MTLAPPRALRRHAAVAPRRRDRVWPWDSVRDVAWGESPLTGLRHGGTAIPGLQLVAPSTALRAGLGKAGSGLQVPGSGEKPRRGVCSDPRNPAPGTWNPPPFTALSRSSPRAGPLLPPSAIHYPASDSTMVTAAPHRFDRASHKSRQAMASVLLRCLAPCLPCFLPPCFPSRLLIGFALGRRPERSLVTRPPEFAFGSRWPDSANKSGDNASETGKRPSLPLRSRPCR